MLARTGGNEFGVLVSLRRGVEDALKAADRIKQVMAAPFKISDLEIRVECAIGVALMHAGDDPEELFRNAQFAVKQAKVAAKPQVYEPEQATEARRRFSIETELRRALDKDQLKLFYQPLIDLKSGEVAGFEALARWTHEDRGEISPTEFIPVAEESGLILHARPLGDGQSGADAGRLGPRRRARGCRSYVASTCPRSRSRATISPRSSKARLRSSGLTGDRLTLELTESAIVQDPARATRVFDALKASNATVAMDDFGTGYSSLAYLQRLPIDVLKIDRSFVSGNDGRSGQRGDRPRGPQPGRGARHVDDRGGDRNGRAGDDSGDARLRLGPGLLFRKAARARRGARILEVTAPLGVRPLAAQEWLQLA